MNSIDTQRICRDFVGREVIQNVGEVIDFWIENAPDDHLEAFGIRKYQEAAEEDGWEQVEDSDHGTFRKRATIKGQPIPEEQAAEAAAEEAGWAQLDSQDEGGFWNERTEQFNREATTWLELVESENDLTLDGHLYEWSEADDWEQLCDEQDIDAPMAEVYEYWMVSDYLCGLLEEQGEIVADVLGLKVWGRQCTGQAIYLDNVIETICKQLGLLDEKGA